MLLKNTAQKIHVYAVDTTTGAAKTGDAANITGYVSLDGTANAIDDTNPAEVDATNMPGVYVFDLTAAETNCDSFALVARSGTANIRLDPIIGFTTAGTAAAIAATVPDTQKVDVNTIKTQALTCAEGVTFGVYVGGTAACAVASTALANTTWTDAKAGYIDAAITSRHASGAAVAKSPATLAAADVTGNLPADVKAYTVQPTVTGATLHADYDASKTAAQAGDEMDLVDAPNATALEAAATAVRTELGTELALILRIPDATPGAAGGFLIVGANEATSFASLDVLTTTTLAGTITATDGDNDIRGVKLGGVKGTALGAEGTAGDMAAALTKFLNVAVASQALTVASVNQTDDIGTNGVGLTAVPWNAAWDAEVQSECTDALTALSFDGKTLVQTLQIIAAGVLGKVSGAGTGTEVFVGLDGSTTRATVTADSSGNRTAVTYA
jgi:hypothetical protein